MITQARKGRITADDMDEQLGALSMEESYTKQERSNLNTMFAAERLETWEAAVLDYLEDLRAGFASLSDQPETDEEKKKLFAMKRRAVLGLVEKISIGRDREMQVTFRLDLLSLLSEESEHTPPVLATDPQESPIQSAGTYTRIRSSLPRRPCAACG